MLLTGNGAAAWGARLARADYIPAFPITPQTEIIETLASWIDRAVMAARLVTLESEHSMVTAAGAAASTGVRVFTATSSQGLLYGMEMVYTVAGWRAPFVLVNVSRAVAAPITLEPDHNDVLAARDSGFLQLHCATCQEVLDHILIAYRVAEDERVRLPVIVNLDGFYLSFTREPVEVPDTAKVDGYLPSYDAKNLGFRASMPLSQAVGVLGGGIYSYFRYQTHLAALNGLEAYAAAAEEYAARFGRRYAAVETYLTEDADYVLLMIGSFATKAKDAIDRLRHAGWRIGLVYPRLLRPFPSDAIRKALVTKRAVAIIDQNVSIGRGGVLHTEVASALYGRVAAPPLLLSFIGGLGGRDISREEFFAIADAMRSAVKRGEAPPPRLLYTETELREMKKLQAIAHAETHHLGQEQ